MGGRRKDGQPSAALLSDLERARIQWERQPVAISLPDVTVRDTGRRHEGNQEQVVVKVPHLISYTTDIEMTGIVLEWTPSAVLVEVQYEEGRKAKVWVWGNAVKRIPDGDS